MYTMGIAEEHDAGVALVSHGRLVAASNEERYCGEKFYYGFPKKALNFLVKRGNLRKEKKINVAIASRFHVSRSFGHWEEMKQGYRILERLLSISKLDRLLWGSQFGPVLLYYLSFLTNVFRKRRILARLNDHDLDVKKVFFIDHHTAHAASAYYTSGYNKALVVTVDASGDGYCSKVFIASNNGMNEVCSIPFFHSPGHYYEYVTLLLGFSLGREGKVTGLAASGKSDKTFPIFSKHLTYDVSRHQFVNHGLYRSAAIKLLKRQLKGFSREDIAAGVQKHLETVVLTYISDMISSYGTSSTNLVVAGGVFANVKLNQAISEIPQVKSLYIFPHMGDGGLAAGAALYLDKKENVSSNTDNALPHVYFGDSISKTEAITIINSYRDKVEVISTRASTSTIATLLSLGNTVAVVAGAMEFGPRALGNRSILFQATDPSVNIWLNKQLNRSEFMPFAPVVRKKVAASYFDYSPAMKPNLAFMTTTVNCTKRCLEEAPAIVHVDGTARPQIVNRTVQPLIDDILLQYHKLTDLHLLINTSFNMHESPIVRTAEDAINAFISSGLDYLLLDRVLVKRI
jgi:carbamoyltransferase